MSADVSIVIAGYSEPGQLSRAVASAERALETLKRVHDLGGEIILAGSETDPDPDPEVGGVRRARSAEKGYGAVVRAGLSAAEGRFLVIGPADGSYDFADGVPMVEALMDGAGLCLGTRFGGAAAPMPFGRRLGNAFLTGVIGVLFGARVSDAHCGLRALSRACYERLRLNGSGSEISSEMVVKAAIRKEIIDEVPVAFSPIGAPPPGTWRDGWRHLRYVFLFSPSWLFAIPALVGSAFGLWILARTGWSEITGVLATSSLGNYWTILGAAALSLSHLGALLAVAGELYGVREGYRRPGPIAVFLARRLTLESMLLVGGALFATGVAVLGYVAYSWVERHFMRVYSVYPAVVGALLMTMGAQTILGGFLLAIIGGNQARFLEPAPAQPARSDRRRRARQVPAGAAPQGLVGSHAFVVPAYKNSPFLADCLRSLTSQTLAANVLVTTSTPSEHIDEAARAAGVKVLVNPLQRGIAGDWNFALRASGARFVTLAHQDDVYYPRFLERSLELFERSRKGAVAFTGYDEIDDDGTPKSSKISKVKHSIQLFALGAREEIDLGRLRTILSFGNTLPCSTVTYDLERIGPFEFSDQYASNLDWDAWWRLATGGATFLHTHERLVGRRHNALTATSELIRDGRRRSEDIVMFRRFWPRPVSDALAYLYRAGY